MGVEKYQVRGENYMRITAEPREHWIVGVDLGCTIDHTAIVVVRHRREPLETFAFKAANASCNNVYKQDVKESYDVLHVERLPIGMSYPDQARNIVSLLERDPLARMQPKPDVVIDCSGVGLPVVQSMEERHGLRPLKVTITAGTEQTRVGNHHYNVAKMLLVSFTDAALNAKELRFAPNLVAAPEIIEELRSFDRSFGASARSAVYGARSGEHDDIVLAVMLAVWRAKGNGPGEMRVSGATGLY